MLVDSHTHLNFKAFRKDFDRVIKEVRDREMQIINVGTLLSTSEHATAIAEKHPDIAFACIGLHPIYVEKFPFDTAGFEALAQREGVVAVGETGLDAYHFKDRSAEEQASIQEQQIKLFRQHVALAERHHLPLMLHCRDAYDQFLDVLEEYGKQFQGQIHTFLGTPKQVERFLALGFNVGFSGPITYEENTAHREIVKQVPLDRIHVETDAPYLTPVPHRREKNFPWYVEHTVRAIAELKGVSFEKVAEQTAENARRTYGLPRLGKKE